MSRLTTVQKIVQQHNGCILVESRPGQGTTFEIRTGAMASKIDGYGGVAKDERIPSRTVVWAAGVKSSPLAQQLGTKLDKQGRVRVPPKLTVPEHEDVFVVGDLAAVAQDQDKEFEKERASGQ